MMYLDHCLIFCQGPNNRVASEPAAHAGDTSETRGSKGDAEAGFKRRDSTVINPT